MNIGSILIRYGVMDIRIERQHGGVAKLARARPPARTQNEYPACSTMENINGMLTINDTTRVATYCALFVGLHSTDTRLPASSQYL